MSRNDRTPRTRALQHWSTGWAARRACTALRIVCTLPQAAVATRRFADAMDELHRATLEGSDDERVQ